MRTPPRDTLTKLTVNAWHGRFVASSRRVAWSAASGLEIAAADWQREWPHLADAMNADTLDVLKRDASGDILSTTISLVGRPIDVVLKRPREKYKTRQWTSVWRTPRARRAWDKALKLRAINVAVEPPLAVFERRNGIGRESVGVYERVPGPTLETADLDAMPPAARQRFFRRCGQLLRRMEARRLAHTDAKSSNWIVFDSPGFGPRPVLIDVYGVRWLNPWLGLFGLHRLLRAMKNHAQYTPADSLAICQGFAPFSEIAEESAAREDEAADAH